MRTLLRFLFLLLLLTVLTALFYLHTPARAAEIRLLTPEGVQSMDLEDYLPGAVAAEMPALFPAEALKAQAVAIRSYAMAAAPRHENADLCTDPACCLGWLDESGRRALWGEDFELHEQSIADACRATRGQYLSYGGQAALAVFHACSAEQTENSGALWSPLPYLISVASPESAADSAAYESVLRFSPQELMQALGVSGTEFSEPVREESGRVASVLIGGQNFSGAELRQLLGLKSTDFEICTEGESICFLVRGSGHGVGMSQYGAKVYAQMGLSYREILAHYYPGTRLESP